MNSKIQKFVKTVLITSSLINLQACEYLGPNMHRKIAMSSNNAQDTAVTTPENIDTAKQYRVDYFNTQTAVPVSPNFNQRKTSNEGQYTVNFDDAEVSEVAKVILGDILHKNFTINPQVTGKISIHTPKPLSESDLIPTLELMLGTVHAALIPQGDIYLINPSQDASYSSSVARSTVGRLPNGFQTHIIPIHYVNVNELNDVIKPLLPEKSLLQFDARRNLLLVSGSSTDINRIVDVISIFDVPYLSGHSFALFTPVHIDSHKLIDELNDIYSIKIKDKSNENDQVLKFIEIEHLNSILVISKHSSYLRDIESWIARLDKSSADSANGIHVYRAQHVNAQVLADTINNVFGLSSGRLTSSSLAPGRSLASGSSATPSNGQTNSNNSTNSSNVFGSASPAADSKLNSAAPSPFSPATNTSTTNNAKIRVVADDGNNALIITSGAQDYDRILHLLHQLDILPTQVMIDATIVEVALQDDLQYGIQWYLQHSNGGTNTISGGAPNGLNINQIATGIATGGFSYAFSSGSKDINAVLQAGATHNNINVISSPSLMVLNNQKASIKVGDSVPVRASVSTNLNGGAANPIQTSSIEMMDTGVNLTVRPRVNASGLVLMDIFQSVNQAVSTTTSNSIDSPTIQKREIETSIAVHSGESIVLGGLIKENNNFNRFGVPFLHEIPVFGSLFGSSNRNNDKNELVVLLTPRVMKSKQDAQNIADEFKRKLTNIYDFTPVNSSAQ